MDVRDQALPLEAGQRSAISLFDTLRLIPGAGYQGAFVDKPVVSAPDIGAYEQ